MVSVWPPIKCSATSQAKFDLDGEEKPPIEACAEQRNEFMHILLNQLSSVIRAGAKSLGSASHAGITKYGQIY